MKHLCVIGDPVEHSLSPLMHNAAIDELALKTEFCYDRLRVQEDELGTFIGSMRTGSMTGASVTMPHKEAIIPFLDELSQEAEICRAVNTVVRRNDRMIGHNTDGIGCMRAFEDAGVSVGGKNIVLLGAGGAAKAIALALARNRADRIFILNRNEERAEELTRLISDVITVQTGGPDCIAAAMVDADILINATSIGMRENTVKESPVPSNLLESGMTVMDIVYDPLETRLLAEARKAGARTIDGLGMLAFQGAVQFELFTGKAAPVNVMKRALREFLSGG